MALRTITRPHDSQAGWLGPRIPRQGLLRGRVYLVVKRGFDLLMVLLFAPLWLPLLGMCAALIKLEAPGDPVFFIQRRTGRGGGMGRGRRLRVPKFPDEPFFSP